MTKTAPDTEADAADGGARYAIYFAPAVEDPLWAFGSSVLGRDAARDEPVPFPAALLERFPNWGDLAAPATHYGFHATLKAPFEPAAGVTEQRIVAETAALARRLDPVDLGRLAVTAMGRFIALRPVEAPPALETRAGSIVESLDHLRAPLTEGDRARRKPETLSPKMRGYLERLGYPFVLDEFRFHMTLSGPLPDAERADAASIIRSLFTLVDAPVGLADLCIFRQRNRTSRFSLLTRHRLGA